MAQTRLFLSVDRTAARQVHAAIELLFEEDGFPLAMTEPDEDGDEAAEISVYVEEPDEAERRLSSILAGFPGAFEIGREKLPEIDWVSRSLEGLAPVRAGRFLVHGAHDRDKRGAGRIAIEIEAGLAFGTGHHGTTAGCLEMLSAIVRREHPSNALDLGAGSGVLAIALAKLARIPVLATDIDPVAARLAAGNARLNGVAALVETHAAAGFHDASFARRRPFDLIVANILARPLMALSPGMARHIAPGGSLALSGILARQRRAVIAAYVDQRFRHVSTLVRDGWATLHLKR